MLRTYYYETKHSAHRMTPAEASRKKNEDRVREIFQNCCDAYAPRNEFAFEVRDVVRILKIKRMFEKGTTGGWTVVLFRVTAVYETKPVTYSIEDMKGKAVEGKFYFWELQLTPAV